MDCDDTGSDKETEGHHLELCTNFIKVRGESPGRRVGVERLDCGAAPGGAAIAFREEFAVARHDGDHDGIVDEPTQDRSVFPLSVFETTTVDWDDNEQICVKNMSLGGILTISKELASRHGSMGGRQHTIFSHLQVVGKVDGAGNYIVRPCGEVHVAYWAIWYNQTGQKLRQIVRGDAVPETSVNDDTLHQARSASLPVGQKV